MGGADRAFEHVLRTTINSTHEITLLGIIPKIDKNARPPYMSHEAYQERYDALCAQKRESMQAYTDRCAEFGVNGRMVIEEGIDLDDVSSTIVEFCDEHNIDVLVLGNNFGHGANDGFGLGENGKEMVDACHCTVMIVK